MAEEKVKTDVKEEKPLKEEKIKASYNDKTFREKFNHIKDNITVEPLLAGLIIPSVLSRFAMGNFNLDKACRVNFNYSEEICDSLVAKNANNYSYYENQVQTLISSIDIWKSVISTALPCIIVMFLGSWSDRNGKRKLCILLPIIGELLTSINNIVNVFFFYEIPVQVTIFLESFFPAITGGWVTMFLGVFSYISDITTEEERTFRVGLVNFCMTVGLPIGIGISGILVTKLGYYGVFSLTATLFTMILLYGFFLLPETEDLLKEQGLPTIQRDNTNKVSFFNVQHVVETMRVAYRKRCSSRRLKVILTLVATFLVFGPSMSEHGILYLYVRNRLNWDMVKYGLYASYSIVLHSFGSMFSITILSKKMQVDDSVLCLISLVSKFVGSIWIAFVKTDLEMYLVPVVEILNATTMTSLRSILTKLVEKDETAKVNSLFSLTETLAGLAFNPLYSWLYMKTLSSFAGTVFILSSILVVPAAVILTYFYIMIRKNLRDARKQALEAQEKKDLESASLPPKIIIPDEAFDITTKM